MGDLQVLADDDRTDVTGDQNTAFDVGFDNPSGAKSFEMFDLNQIRAGITTEEIIVKLRGKRETIGTAVAFIVQHVYRGDDVLEDLLDIAPTSRLESLPTRDR